MKRLFAMISLRWRRPFEFAAWGAIIAVILASGPFVFDLVGCGAGWIVGLFPYPNELWKECRWCFLQTCCVAFSLSLFPTGW